MELGCRPSHSGSRVWAVNPARESHGQNHPVVVWGRPEGMKGMKLNTRNKHQEEHICFRNKDAFHFNSKLSRLIVLPRRQRGARPSSLLAGLADAPSSPASQNPAPDSAGGWRDGRVEATVSPSSAVPNRPRAPSTLGWGPARGWRGAPHTRTSAPRAPRASPKHARRYLEAPPCSRPLI